LKNTTFLFHTHSHIYVCTYLYTLVWNSNTKISFHSNKSKLSLGLLWRWNHRFLWLRFRGFIICQDDLRLLWKSGHWSCLITFISCWQFKSPNKYLGAAN
jgi:hypothetical protein